jgi:glucans biosynthesis protein
MGPASRAYRFAIKRTQGVVMDIEARLFPAARHLPAGHCAAHLDVLVRGIRRGRVLDWRPEIHDSDGLALWTGAGERIWRPLNNPPVTTTSTFCRREPQGFGLLQRDRRFDHYLDGVRYDRRPTLWVEPLDAWGRAPCSASRSRPTTRSTTTSGCSDAGRAGPGRQSHTMRYRLHWLAEEPYPAENVALTVATRMGRGGEPGKPRPPGVYKFAVEFAGGPLATLDPDVKPEAVVEASRGRCPYVFMTEFPELHAGNATST